MYAAHRCFVNDQWLIWTGELLQELRSSNWEGLPWGRGDLSNRLLDMGETRNGRDQGQQEKWAFSGRHGEYTSLISLKEEISDLEAKVRRMQDKPSPWVLLGSCRLPPWSWRQVGRIGWYVTRLWRPWVLVAQYTMSIQCENLTLKAAIKSAICMTRKVWSKARAKVKATVQGRDTLRTSVFQQIPSKSQRNLRRWCNSKACASFSRHNTDTSKNERRLYKRI